MYNTGTLMRKCFESLVMQSIGIDKLDIVVVDDGSTDDGFSIAIIDEYVSKFSDSFRVITKPNGGQERGRNMAFPIATGEFITCSDSDEFPPDWC